MQTRTFSSGTAGKVSGINSNLADNDKRSLRVLSVAAGRSLKNASRPAKTSRSSVLRNGLIWTALLSLLAVSKSFADNLPDFASLVQNEGDTVVKISVSTTSNSASAGSPGFDLENIPDALKPFFDQIPQNPGPQNPRRGQGFGSGFIISDDGYIITNAHVVDNADDIQVALTDRRQYKAELIGMDKPSDIALLKVEANNLPVSRLGDSDGVQVGEWVLAIGSPFGFEYSATQGIVSAVARNLPADTYVPFIQTDVAVNPGNSGGPLFNTDGEVIGVNSQIYSRSGGYQGLSFAIPINVAKNIVEQLRAKGYASRGWLGVMIQDVDLALAESFGLDKPTGALVANVTADSPADMAGLENGDIITNFNGKEVTGSSKLPPMVGAVGVGETVPLTVLRNEKELVLDVTIAELESDRTKVKVAKKKDNARLGLVVGSLPADKMEELGVEHGVLISEVLSSTPAADAGLQPGDVLVSLNREPIHSVEDFARIVESLPENKSFAVLLQRGGAALFRAIKIPAGQE
ncbi:MAG: DegQ family serine endoprotease [Gammaproteobacteria bacterium]|nr:DegQ family serine endoprotease [Gammaproteobacteria bacterium]